jgi:flavorubredoxin
MAATKIVDNLYWTGVFDPDLRIFDIVIPTEKGTTYNSYLIKGNNKIALIEACKMTFEKDYIKNVEEICPIKDIDYIILNHTEPDHSGTLPTVVDLHPGIEVIYSKTAKNFVENILNRKFNGRAVGDGDSIDLGGLTLEFFHTPFLHWPDTMFTYLREYKVLFPCDFLGAHYCDINLFNDKLENKNEAFDAFIYYYMCIMRPFKEHILNALKKIKNLDIKMVCPSHGPILRENVNNYINFYMEQAERFNIRKDSVKAVIIYASAYGNTRSLGEAINKGIQDAGVDTKIFDAANADMNELINELEISKGIVVGSPTINAKAPKPIFDIFGNLVVLNVAGRLAGVFGSYGWSGEGIRICEDIVKTLRMRIPLPSFKVKMTPSEDELKDAYKWGYEFGISILEQN